GHRARVGSRRRGSKPFTDGLERQISRFGMAQDHWDAQRSDPWLRRCSTRSPLGHSAAKHSEIAESDRGNLARFGKLTSKTRAFDAPFFELGKDLEQVVLCALLPNDFRLATANPSCGGHAAVSRVLEIFARRGG